MLTRPLPLVVIDLETTGLHPARSGILQIGAVDLRGPEPREFTMDVRAYEGCRIEADALAVNGVALAECRAESRIAEDVALLALLEWLGPDDFLLGGMNPRFDRDFLVSASRRASALHDCSIRFPASHRTIDLHTLAIAHALRIGALVPAKGFHTDAIFDLLGMEPEPKPHVALVGARMIASALCRLLP